jgi:hypothetical protein
MSREIKCLKYNYSFEEEVQNFNNFEATIKLSKDGKELIITNFKPITSPEYVLEKDPDILAEVEPCLCHRHKRVKSSASCRLDQVEGILFGGISSRFWMLRKHLNTID